MFLEIEGSELKVDLAQEETTIYFTKTHVADLKDVIKSDENLTGEEKYRNICAAAKAEKDEIFSQHPVKRNSNRQVSHINTQQPRSVVRGYRDIPKVILVEMF